MCIRDRMERLLVEVAKSFQSTDEATSSQPKKARVEPSSSFRANLAAILGASDDEDAPIVSGESPAESEVAAYERILPRSGYRQTRIPSNGGGTTVGSFPILHEQHVYS